MSPASKSPADDPAEALAVGLAHHRAGQLAQADACYRTVLGADPANVTALHLLGVLAHQRGQPEVAADLISRAIALNDRLPELHGNLGNALQAVGRTAEAEASFRRALSSKAGRAKRKPPIGRPSPCGPTTPMRTVISAKRFAFRESRSKPKPAAAARWHCGPTTCTRSTISAMPSRVKVGWTKRRPAIVADRRLIWREAIRADLGRA
jgi:tetratricopeptide (TPR) repeat protein